MTSPDFPHNWRILVFYHLATSIALTVVSNITILDFLLLRMKIDLGSFGLIKSSIYFLPAVGYLAATPLLQRLNRDRSVCAFAYLARVLLPLPLPLLPLISTAPWFLIGGVMVISSLAFSCAMFANNSLLTIFRATLPEGEFNRRAAILNALFGIPCMLLGLPVAWYLSTLDGISDARFYVIFALLQLGSVLFEIPAAWALLRLRVRETPRRKMRRWSEYLLPYRDRVYRMLLGFTFIQFLWIGMLSTYWVVYLLKVWQFPLAWVVALELVLCLVLAFFAAPAGGWVDRYGYPRVFGYGAAATTVLMVCFCAFPNAWVMFLGYAFLVHNGSAGLFSGTLRMLEQSGAARLTRPACPNVYVSAFALMQSFGSFLGCLAAGWLYEFLAARTGDLNRTFYWYWLICGLFPVLLIVWARSWRRAEAARRRIAPAVAVLSGRPGA